MGKFVYDRAAQFDVLYAQVLRLAEHVGFDMLQNLDRNTWVVRNKTDKTAREYEHFADASGYLIERVMARIKQLEAVELVSKYRRTGSL